MLRASYHLALILHLSKHINTYTNAGSTWKSKHLIDGRITGLNESAMITLNNSTTSENKHSPIR